MKRNEMSREEEGKLRFLKRKCSAKRKSIDLKQAHDKLKESKCLNFTLISSERANAKI